MGQRYHNATQDLRTLVTTIGIDQWNASMLIPYLWTAPVTTDLDMNQIILLIEHLQKTLNDMGANLVAEGQLDLETADALTQICGPGWKSVPWYQIIEAVIWAHEHGPRIVPRSPRAIAGKPAAVGYAMGDLSLPSMPGGALGWAAAAAAAYYLLLRR